MFPSVEAGLIENYIENWVKDKKKATSFILVDSAPEGGRAKKKKKKESWLYLVSFKFTNTNIGNIGISFAAALPFSAETISWSADNLIREHLFLMSNWLVKEFCSSVLQSGQTLVPIALFLPV